MAEFVEQDLSGARFERVSLRNAASPGAAQRRTVRGVDLSGAEIRGALLHGAGCAGSSCATSRSPVSSNVTVNGVDIAPLVEAELNRRTPERAKMRPDDLDGFREAWAILERLWDGTIERARSLPAEALHTQVDGEWSFIQTLRHLELRQRGVGRPHDPRRPVPVAPARPPVGRGTRLGRHPVGPRGAADARRGARRAARAAGDGRAGSSTSLTEEQLASHGVADRAGVAAARGVPVQGVPAHRAQRGVGAPPLTPSAISPRSKVGDYINFI